MLDAQHLEPRRGNRVSCSTPELKANWNDKLDVLDIACTTEDEHSTDARLLAEAFDKKVIFRGNGKTLLQELEARGYDLSTLQFSICRKVAA